jgi:hypothetical protein
MWIYTSTPHTPSWRSTSLVKHRDNFTYLKATVIINILFYMLVILYIKEHKNNVFKAYTSTYMKQVY